MPKRKYIVPCDKTYCDYVPCLEERIARLEEQGLDSAPLREQLAEVRAQDERFWLAESEWLATLDATTARV